MFGKLHHTNTIIIVTGLVEYRYSIYLTWRLETLGDMINCWSFLKVTRGMRYTTSTAPPHRVAMDVSMATSRREPEAFFPFFHLPLLLSPISFLSSCFLIVKQPWPAAEVEICLIRSQLSSSLPARMLRTAFRPDQLRMRL